MLHSHIVPAIIGTSESFSSISAFFLRWPFHLLEFLRKLHPTKKCGMRGQQPSSFLSRLFQIIWSKSKPTVESAVRGSQTSWADRSVLLSELMILLTSYPARQIDVVEKIKLKRSELSRGESYILLEMYVFSLQNFVQTRALFFHTTCMIIDEPTT